MPMAYEYSGIWSIFGPFEHNIFIVDLFIMYLDHMKIISKWNGLALGLLSFYLVVSILGNYVKTESCNMQRV